MKVNSHEDNAKMLAHLLPLEKFLPDIYHHTEGQNRANKGLTVHKRTKDRPKTRPMMVSFFLHNCLVLGPTLGRAEVTLVPLVIVCPFALTTLN